MNLESYYKTIGNNVKKYRLKKGFSQEEFAEKINKTANYISLLENGHKGLNVSTLIEIAYALEILPGVLFEDAEHIVGRVPRKNKVIH